MSAYGNDLRVRSLGGGHYDVTCCPGTGPIGRVFPEHGGGFGAKVNGDLSDAEVYATADEAIRSLIGDPQ